eukprot:2681406-Heterocapsa_arctica.AAC.1
MFYVAIVRAMTMRTWRLHKALALPREPLLLDDVRKSRPRSLEQQVKSLALATARQRRLMVLGSPSGCEVKP